MSSTGIERLFSEAGVLLTEERNRMLPKVTKKSVYIRYDKKQRKVDGTFGISVSEEELKKRIEDDEADEYEAGVYWTKTWLSKVTLWLLFDWCDFHFSEFLFDMENWKSLLTEIVFYDDIFCNAPTCIW